MYPVEIRSNHILKIFLTSTDFYISQGHFVGSAGFWILCKLRHCGQLNKNLLKH